MIWKGAVSGILFDRSVGGDNRSMVAGQHGFWFREPALGRVGPCSVAFDSPRVSRNLLESAIGKMQQKEQEDMVEPYVHLGNWLQREDGQDLAEYALLIGLIALVVFGAVVLLGENLSGLFSQLASQVGTW